MLATVGVTLEKGNEFDFGEWFGEGDGDELSKARGFRVAKWYKMVFAMRLPPQMSMEDLQKQEVPQSYLALIEFDSEEVSVEELRRMVEISLTKVTGCSVKEEVDVWELKKVMGDANAILEGNSVFEV